MIALLLLAAVQAAPNTPNLPINAGEPVLNYMACLFDKAHPRIATGVPAGAEARERIVAALLAECRQTRIRSAQLADQALAKEPGFSDPANRAAAVEAFLTGFEEKLRWTVVKYEQFVEETRAYEACVESGRGEC